MLTLTAQAHVTHVVSCRSCQRESARASACRARPEESSDAMSFTFDPSRSTMSQLAARAEKLLAHQPRLRRQGWGGQLSFHKKRDRLPNY